MHSVNEYKLTTNERVKANKGNRMNIIKKEKFQINKTSQNAKLTNSNTKQSKPAVHIPGGMSVPFCPHNLVVNIHL